MEMQKYIDEARAAHGIRPWDTRYIATEYSCAHAGGGSIALRATDAVRMP